MKKCFEFQQKKWPNLVLKSPGIKPKPESKSKLGAFHFGSRNRMCGKSLSSANTSEDEQTPAVFDSPTISSPIQLLISATQCEKKLGSKCEEQEFIALKISQMNQASDAPTLLPRNASPQPPPVPIRDFKHFAMRMYNVATMNIEQSLHRLCLQLPNTSTIMMRRNLMPKPTLATTGEDGSTSSSTESVENVIQ